MAEDAEKYSLSTITGKPADVRVVTEWESKEGKMSQATNELKR